MKESIYDWMKAGYTIVPNVFIKRFSQLKLSADEFVLVVYLLMQINHEQPNGDMIKLSHQLGWDNEKVYEVLNSLMEKNYLDIELQPDEEGKQTDHYTLRPLFDAVDQLLNQKKTGSTHQTQNSSLPNNGYSYSPQQVDPKEYISTIVGLVQEEFGRALSSLETECIAKWFLEDEYDYELVRLAIREAVIRQAFNLKYIDRILINWENSNIKTAAEAELAISQFPSKGDKQQSSTNQFQGQNTFAGRQAANNAYDTIQFPDIDWDNR